MDFSTPIGRRFSSKLTFKKTPQGDRKKPVEKKPTGFVPQGETVTISTPATVEVKPTQTPVKPEVVQTPVKAEPKPVSSDRQLSETGTSTGTTGYTSPSYSNENIQVGANGTLMMMDDTMVGLAEPNATFDRGTAPSGIFSSEGTTTTAGASTVEYLRSSTAKEKGHAALLATDCHTALMSTSKIAQGGWMSAVAGTGGALLLVHGATKMVTADNATQRLEGAAEGSWGAQMAMPTALGEVGKVAGKTLGVVGGGIQAGLGVKKAIDGIKSKDKEKALLGGADALAGTCWVLSSVGIASGVTAPLFIGITVGAKVYQHREKIAAAAKKAPKVLKKAVQKTGQTLQRGAKAVSDALPRFQSGGLFGGVPNPAMATPQPLGP